LYADPYIDTVTGEWGSAQELGKRWGISPRRISQIGNSPIQKDWDALAGLPVDFIGK